MKMKLFSNILLGVAAFRGGGGVVGVGLAGAESTTEVEQRAAKFSLRRVKDKMAEASIGMEKVDGGGDEGTTRIDFGDTSVNSEGGQLLGALWENITARHEEFKTELALLTDNPVDQEKQAIDQEKKDLSSTKSQGGELLGAFQENIIAQHEQFKTEKQAIDQEKKDLSSTNSEGGELLGPFQENIIAQHEEFKTELTLLIDKSVDQEKKVMDQEVMDQEKKDHLLSTAKPSLTTQGLSPFWQVGSNAFWSKDCDFPHMGDYKQVQSTVDQCDPTCSASSSCTHFTWSPTGTCYLKQGGAALANAQATSIGSGVVCGIKKIDWKDSYTCSWAQDCDFPNMGDYKQVPNTGGEQCDPLCVADSTCSHFAWNKGTCYLKKGGVSMFQAKRLASGSGVMCGIKKLQGWQRSSDSLWMHSADFYGRGDYRQVPNQPIWNCGFFCAGDSMCTHFTYYQGTCYLKKGGAYPVDATSGSSCCIGKFSGIKRLFDQGYPGPHQWMTSLPDRTVLKDILFPGTHDAAAGPQSADWFSQCQFWTIEEQLNRGIRFFDLRLHYCKDAQQGMPLCLWHGSDYLDLSLEEVNWVMYGFLRRNPGETILVKLKVNGGNIFKTMPTMEPEDFQKKVEGHFSGHHEWYGHPGVTAANANMNIRLGQVRGLIVPFWDDGPKTSAWGLDFGQVNQRPTYEFYSVSDAYLMFKMRAENMSLLLATNRLENPNTWFENPSSFLTKDWLGIPSQPIGDALDMNPRVTQHLKGVDGYIQQFGIISMDFPTQEMINLMINICRKRQFSFVQ